MNREGYNPLLAAIADGDVAAVESFLQTPGINVDRVFTRDLRVPYTPLSRAIECNHKTIVELLLAHGAAVNGPDDDENTPLQHACNKDNANERYRKLTS